jgi:hypothetical protein
MAALYRRFTLVVVTTAPLKALFPLHQQLMTLFSKRVSNSRGSFHIGLALIDLTFGWICAGVIVILSVYHIWAPLHCSHRSPPLSLRELEEI